MHPTVLVPISFSGSRKSTSGSRAVLLNSASIEMPMPAAMMPPRYSRLGRDGVESDRRAQVDHDARSAVLVERRHAVHHAVRAHFARIVVADLQPGIGGMGDEHRFGVEIALRHQRRGWRSSGGTTLRR